MKINQKELAKKLKPLKNIAALKSNAKAHFRQFLLAIFPM